MDQAGAPVSAFILISLKKLGSWLATVPLYVWVILCLCIALYVSNGRTDAAQKLAADRLVTINAMNDAAETAHDKAVEIREVEVIKYVDRIKVIKEKASVIEKQIPVYIPVDAPDVAGGFRLLHDAAATGVPIAESVQPDDGAPVPLADVAATVTANYAQCAADKELIVLWQDYYQRLCDTYGCK